MIDSKKEHHHGISQSVSTSDFIRLIKEGCMSLWDGSQTRLVYWVEKEGSTRRWQNFSPPPLPSPSPSTVTYATLRFDNLEQFILHLHV